jgi:NAD-dependent SIR2 family protein deacetylase
MSSPNILPADPALTELREAYASGNLIVFVGSGLSTAAGLPDQKMLVELLVERARARHADPERIQEIIELLNASKLADALAALKQALGGPEFHAAIERALDDRGHMVPEVAQAIAALVPQLRAVITTNIDRLLERAFGGAWPALASAPADLPQRRHFILKIHGTLSEHDTWVLTRDDHD